MTGGGGGGVVAVLGRNGDRRAVENLVREFGEQHGAQPHLFEGSSPGVDSFGVRVVQLAAARGTRYGKFPEGVEEGETAQAVFSQGKRPSQSPIDIETKDVTPAGDLAPIRFNYQLSPLKIINNGFTVQVSYDAGSSITVNGESYELIQFHFHHPSETTIDGQKYDLELHLVHRNAQGKLAVVAVLLKSGAQNPPLRELWSYLPKDIGHEAEHKKVQLNAADFLPNDRNYYKFSGSLTIPPCTEGVTWLVMRTPVEVSPTQIAAFANLYPLNARPLQPLNGRSVTKSSFEKASAE